jgi:D-methionine transport system substrate-binding protein
MKKFLVALVGIFTLSLVACGGAKSDENTLIVGASNVPHSEILEQAKPILEKEGITLEIKKYQDYVLPNKALDDKELDANYFQHIPYLEQQMKDNNYKFENAGGVHIEPIGMYSKKYKKLTDIPKGATVVMSNSVSDQGRMLSLLQDQGLIKLKEGMDTTKAELKDIVEKDKNLKFEASIDASMLVQAYENNEGDVVLINSNYAIDAGLIPTEDAIALEDSNSPYVNIIAVREGDKDKKNIKTLLEVLHSKEIQDFITKEYKNAVVPVSQ